MDSAEVAQVTVRETSASTADLVWTPPTLKVLSLLLAGCLAFYIRHRWQERRMLAEETGELERSLHASGTYR